MREFVCACLCASTFVSVCLLVGVRACVRACVRVYVYLGGAQEGRGTTWGFAGQRCTGRTAARGPRLDASSCSVSNGMRDATNAGEDNDAPDERQSALVGTARDCRPSRSPLLNRRPTNELIAPRRASTGIRRCAAGPHLP